MLLTGPKGVGLGTIAKALASELAGPEVIIIEPTLHSQQKTANINVSDIKTTQKLLQNKRKSALVVVIDEADKMTATTPETLLKLLEEPGDNVYFILTSHNLINMPQTIVSRSQTIHAMPTDDTQQLTAVIKPADKKKQIEFIANGLPAEVIRLATDEEYFRAQARLFEAVKAYISASVYDRLKVVSSLKDRDEAVDFLQGLAKVTTIMAEKTGKTTNLAVLSDVLERVSINGNLKAQLTYLALNY
jgi:DNA polymerase III delta prime subunit